MRKCVLIILFLACCQCTTTGPGFLGWKDLYKSTHAAYPELDLYAHGDMKYMLIGIHKETGMMFYITAHKIEIINKIPEGWEDKIN